MIEDERTATAPAVTGRQWTIRNGSGEATVTELAAALRSYRRLGVDLVEPFAADELPPSGSGILLAPWGNRIRDGRWLLDGKVQQLDITEPSRGNATHGLLRNAGYAPVAVGHSKVVLRAEIFPQHGFPFRMTHTAAYAIDADGHLAVEQDLENHGPAPAPAAIGAHPYLRVGDVPVEDLVLTVRGERRLVADDRLIPVSEEPVAGDADFRAGRRIGDVRVDVAITDLASDADGLHRHVLEAPDGTRVALWSDGTFPYAHVFVTEKYRGRPLAVAVEPMSAPADAYNSGAGLVWLGRGEHLTGSWGIQSWL
jgi:aldose 1-epimerase